MVTYCCFKASLNPHFVETGILCNLTPILILSLKLQSAETSDQEAGNDFVAAVLRKKFHNVALSFDFDQPNMSH